MKKKEIKQIAWRIAANEKILSKSTDENEKRQAREDIMNLSSRIYNLEDMMKIDDLVQEFLKNS